MFIRKECTHEEASLFDVESKRPSCQETQLCSLAAAKQQVQALRLEYMTMSLLIRVTKKLDNNLTVCQHKNEVISRCHTKLLTTPCACMVFQQRPRRTFSSHNSGRAHAHAHHGSCMAGSSKAKTGTSIISNWHNFIKGKLAQYKQSALTWTTCKIFLNFYFFSRFGSGRRGYEWLSRRCLIQ